MRDYEVLLCKEEIASPDKDRPSRNDTDMGDCFDLLHRTQVSQEDHLRPAMTLI